MSDGVFSAALQFGEGGGGGGGSGGGGGGSAISVPIVCRYYEAPAPDQVSEPGAQIMDVSGLAVGDVVWSRCHVVGGAGGDFVLTTWGAAAPVITAAQLAELAVARLVVPLPGAQMWPGPANQLTGLPTWLHLDNWGEQTATASVGGLSVTAHARPTRARWSFPDGSTSCSGAGTPWAPGASEGATDCSIVPLTASFTRRGAQDRATVTVSWDRWWSSSDSQGEQLAPLDRTTSMPLVIREHQVTTG